MMESRRDNENVPPTPAQQAQAACIARELAALGFALPGTFADRMIRAGQDAWLPEIGDLPGYGGYRVISPVILSKIG